MTSLRGWSLASLAVGLALGTWADAAAPAAVGSRGPDVVLAVDFHVHSFGGDGAVAPWSLPGEARRRGLQAVVVTNHNQTLAARLGRALGRLFGGPIVILGEEITNPGYHLIAAGIERTVDWRQPAAAAIDAIHAQGGIAIAAHPHAGFWPGFDDAALRRLDAAERVHPLVFARAKEAAELGELFRRAEALGRTLTPIGSSDFHAFTSLGLCRTYVFAREASERGILDAVRAGRTVVYDPQGRGYGDPGLLRLLGGPPPAAETGRGLRAASAVAAWLGLAGLVVAGVFRSAAERPRGRTAC